MEKNKIVFSGTSEQIEKLEKMVYEFPDYVIANKGERVLKANLHVQLLSDRTAEIYPIGCQEIEVSPLHDMRCLTCNSEYVEFDLKGGLLCRIRYKEKK